jgi:hypothetical protein
VSGPEARLFPAGQRRRTAPSRAGPPGPLPTHRGGRGGLHPVEAEAANLFFQLVSARYERASLIVTSNKPFGRWGEVFGDDIVAAAMIDRLVHHAEVISLKGDSYRLKDRDLGQVPAAATEES